MDLRHAMRGLVNSPGFTLVAVLTLTLGIGANTAIFSVVHTVLLRPLPFPEPDRLVRIFETRPEKGWSGASLSRPNFRDYREQSRAFEDIGALLGASRVLSGDGFPERVEVGRISAGFFQVLGVRPLLGRTFARGEDEPEAENRVALLNNEFWNTRFGADSAIVGRPIKLDDESYTVVGVLPAGRPWLDRGDIFIPLVRDPGADRGNFILSTVGRLAPGVSIAAAQSDLELIAQRLSETYPELQTHGRIGIRLFPSSSWVATEGVQRALWVLLGAVGFLLLIACVNLTNLLLARGTARQRETAVRAALGAERARIVRQLLTESLLLGFTGAGLGLLLGLWVIGLLKTFDPGDMPRLAEVSLNGWVLGFTLAISMLAGVVSGLAPAFQAPYSGLLTALREGDRGTAGTGARRRMRNVLVGLEVALSLILLVGAGLLIRSFGELVHVDRGFQTENRVFFRVTLPPSYREDDSQTGNFIEQFNARVAEMPQVVAAAAVSLRVINSGSTGMGIVAAGQEEGPGGTVPWASWRLISSGYFEALGLPLLSGRTFDTHDMIGEPWRVMISQRLAELLWPGEDPVGRQAILWEGQNNFSGEVIGVVGDMRERGLERDPTLAVYLPYYGAGRSPVNFLVHTAGDPSALITELRPLLAEIDPNLPISDIQRLDEIVDDSVAGRRFNMMLLLSLSGLALALALAGIYGVQSYTVARRTSEIGIRVALGASSGTVIRQIVGQGMLPALIGMTVGALGAFVLSRFLSSMLYGVEPLDPTTYVGVGLILGAAALISCYVPARRAMRVDPVAALREE
jgi:putative ABC transport system permease protein